MKLVKLDTAAARPAGDDMAHPWAAYLAAYLFSKTRGALHGKGDEVTRRGLWFYSTDAATKPDAATVDEMIFEEDQRWRFRSVIFRLGSMASETTGVLGGVMRLVPQDPGVDLGPPRHYVVHASFYPEMGLWFRAAVVSDAPEESRRAVNGPTQP